MSDYFDSLPIYTATTPTVTKGGSRIFICEIASLNPDRFETYINITNGLPQTGITMKYLGTVDANGVKYTFSDNGSEFIQDSMGEQTAYIAGNEEMRLVLNSLHTGDESVINFLRYDSGDSYVFFEYRYIENLTSGKAEIYMIHRGSIAFSKSFAHLPKEVKRIRDINIIADRRIYADGYYYSKYRWNVAEEEYELDTDYVKPILPAPIIQVSQGVNFGDTNPTVMIECVGGVYKNPQVLADWNITVGTTGLVADSMDYTALNIIDIDFVGTAEEGTITIQAKKEAFTPEASANTNTVNVVVAEEIEEPELLAKISITNSINWGMTNPFLNIRAVGATFADIVSSVDFSDWILDFGTTGLAESYIEKIDLQNVRIYLGGGAVAGTIKVTAKPGAFDPETTANTNTAEKEIAKAPAPIIEISTTIYEATTNPHLFLDCVLGTFASPQNSGDFTKYFINAGGTDLVFFSIQKINDTRMRFGFSGVAELGTISIQARKEAFNPTASETSNIAILEIIEVPAPEIWTTSEIIYGTENPSIILHCSTNFSFMSSIANTDFIVYNTTTQLALSSVSFLNPNLARLDFTGFAWDGELSITAKKSAFLVAGKNSNELDLDIIEGLPPTIITTSDIIFGDIAPSVIIRPIGGDFKSAVIVGDLTINLGTSDLTVDGITYNRDNDLTPPTWLDIDFLGTADVGEIAIKASAGAFDIASGETNNLKIEISEFSGIIATASIINIDDVNPSFIATLDQIKQPATFKSAVANTDFTIGYGTTTLLYGSFTRINSKQVKFDLTGTAVAGDITITALASAFDLASANSNEVEVNVVAIPNISTLDEIEVDNVDPKILVTTDNSVFRLGINENDFTIGLGTTALIVEDVQYVDDSNVYIWFGGTAVAGDITITAKASAFLNQVNNSNEIEINVVAVVAPEIYSTGVQQLAIDPSFDIELDYWEASDFTFKTGISLSDLIIDSGLGYLTVTGVTKDNDKLIILSTTGQVPEGVWDLEMFVTVKASAFDSSTQNSNTIEIPVFGI